MFWLTQILLFLCGAAGASTLITQRFPEFQEGVTRIVRLKSLAGFFLLLLAIGKILDLFIGGFYVGWLLYLLELMLMLGLGLIQGVAIIKQIIPRPSVITRIENWRSNLLPYEEMLGLTAMVLSVFSVLRYIF